jgi:hypothetical protein
MGAEIALDGREYKLLLDPGRFPGAPSEEAINRFWREHLREIIAGGRGRRSGEGRRKNNPFKLKKQRSVGFWDTKDCLLAGNDYSLRERADVIDGPDDTPEHKLTLKLRTADLFIAAATSADTPDEADAKFEEDISPLEVVTTGRAGKKTVALAHPPSIRTRFAVSIDQDLDESTRIKTLGDVFELYPNLRTNLELDGARKVKAGARMVPGPSIREVVFRNAEVDLDHELAAEFSFTLWYFEKQRSPRIAELSFRYKTGDEDPRLAPALRALKLFCAMQQGLERWLDVRNVSKTALALPCKPAR